MLIYQKNGKLNISFNKKLPPEADIILEKSDKVTLNVGGTIIGGDTPTEPAVEVKTITALKNALTDPAVTNIKLTSDLSVTSQLKIEKDVTIDLAGHIFDLSKTSLETPIRVVSGEVTFKNGTVDAASAPDTTVGISAMGGNVILENMNVYVDTPKESCVYAAYGSQVKVLSGRYENRSSDKYEYGEGAPLVLNIKNDDTGTIECFGGTFIGRDPALGDDNLGGTFVASGYRSVPTIVDGKQGYIVEAE